MALATQEQTPQPPTRGVRRLNHIVPEKLYEQVVALSKETKLDITDLVRLGLGLVMVAVREAQEGNRIVVTDAKGLPIKELILPPGL